jgi:ABC-type branched-subunit amino acid transport system ATPase component
MRIHGTSQSSCPVILWLLHFSSLSCILIVEQNARKSLSTMSRGYVLETGRISLEESSEELRSNPEVQREYLRI